MGRLHTSGEIDTIELVVNRPIRNKIVQKYMTPEIREELKNLKEENRVSEFREIAEKIKDQIETEYNLHNGTIEFTNEQRGAYTTVGGYPELDGQYTIFGECVSGFETIDKIAALNTDENNRPFTDVKITVTILNE